VPCDTHWVRAAVHARYGKPEVVSVGDVATPSVGSDEILVEVHASTVTRTDCHYRAASPFPMRFFTGLMRPKPRIWGCEFAGRVVSVGDAVENFEVNDRVFGYVEGRFGAHAEYLVIRADRLVAMMPDGCSYEDAAPMTEATHYAKTLVDLARVTKGSDVLVYGASGGTGAAVVQLARLAGARVTAVCATDGVEMVTSLRPDKVVDYTKIDVTAGEERYDVIVDAWGMLSFRQCKPIMKRRCLFTSTGPGPHLQNILMLVATRFSRRRVVFRPPKFDRSMLEEFARMLASGELRAPIDRTYPLEDIVDAYRFVESGRKLGNVVIAVVPEVEESAPLRE
jgi:NADPH:quinone reductase-like Zn-dependent oxidoreductase